VRPFAFTRFRVFQQQLVVDERLLQPESFSFIADYSHGCFMDLKPLAVNGNGKPMSCFPFQIELSFGKECLECCIAVLCFQKVS